MSDPVWLYQSELLFGGLVNADRVAFVTPDQMSGCTIWFSGVAGDNISVDRPFELVIWELFGADAVAALPDPEKAIEVVNKGRGEIVISLSDITPQTKGGES